MLGYGRSMPLPTTLRVPIFVLTLLLWNGAVWNAHSQNAHATAEVSFGEGNSQQNDVDGINVASSSISSSYEGASAFAQASVIHPSPELAQENERIYFDPDSDVVSMHLVAGGTKHQGDLFAAGDAVASCDFFDHLHASNPGFEHLLEIIPILPYIVFRHEFSGDIPNHESGSASVTIYYYSNDVVLTSEKTQDFQGPTRASGTISMNIPANILEVNPFYEVGMSVGGGVDNNNDEGTSDFSHTFSLRPFSITDAYGNPVPMAEQIRIAGDDGGAYLTASPGLNAGRCTNCDQPQLIWTDGDYFSAGSNFVKTMPTIDTNKYPGYYVAEFPIVVPPQLGFDNTTNPTAPAFGSQISFRMSCLSAPTDGQFSFWEATATAPTLTLTNGQSATNLFAISENNGAPGSDPSGAIANRRFTATKPGLYTIAFTAVDTSTNGPNGSSIYLPSASLTVQFLAGSTVRITDLNGPDGNIHIQFAAQIGLDWQLQAATVLGTNADWTNVASKLTGADRFVDVAAGPFQPVARYYRFVGTP